MRKMHGQTTLMFLRRYNSIIYYDILHAAETNAQIWVSIYIYMNYLSNIDKSK